MGLIRGKTKLTMLDSNLERQRDQTWPGMAHFAGTGIARFTCRQCGHWTGCGVESGYHPANGKFSGLIKPRPCEKYATMMGVVAGPAVPHDARACKYFVENPAPPAISKRS